LQQPRIELDRLMRGFLLAAPNVPREENGEFARYGGAQPPVRKREIAAYSRT